MMNISAGSWLGASIAHSHTTSRSPNVAQIAPTDRVHGSRFLRYASPNEQSVISRESLGYYHGLIVAAKYRKSTGFDGYSKSFFYNALESCIDEHSYLSVTIEDADTDKSYIKRVRAIDLDKHTYIQQALHHDDSNSCLGEVLASAVDTPFPDDIPPWKVIVYPLSEGCLIALSFSHALGDGISGKAFHRTFSRAMKVRGTATRAVASIRHVASKPLPPPFDTPERLPISWSYLISSSIAYLIPSLLGRRASASNLDTGTWLGAPIQVTPTTMRVREVSADTLTNALKVAREHDAKLTGLFQHLVARALSKYLPEYPSITNFVSATAVNMRKTIGVSDDQGGLYTSGCSTTHSRKSPTSIRDSLTQDDWAEISSATQSLAEAWATTQDQFIGLLKYLPSIRNWLANREGTKRTCSFQVSNIGVFEALDQAPDKGLAESPISDIIFASPGEIVGGVLKFTLDSLKRGSLRYVVSWRKGALNIGEGDEGKFIEMICESIEKDLGIL